MGVKLFLILVVMMSIGIAGAAYMDDTKASLDGIVWFWINDSYIDSWACCDSNTLSLGINASTINFTIDSNKTIASPSFLNDNMTVTVSGTAGFTNISAIMANASQSYNLTANGAFIESRNTTVSRLVWFNYTGSYPATMTISWNNSQSPSPAANGNPDITSYSPALTYTADVNNLITFDAGANQSVQWTWTGTIEGTGDGTANSTATQTWTTTGIKTVSVSCTNANGSCTNGKTWTVTVVSDGSGGGTNYDYLDGTVNVAGATITTNPNVGSTSGGAYSFGYVFIDGNSYWINVSKAGYDSNNTLITFNEDHEVWNPTLTLSGTPTPTPTTTPQPSTIYNVQYQYGCSSPTEHASGGINVVYGLILIVIIVVLLVIIAGVIQESPMMGIVIAGILIIASGAIYPQIVSSVYNVPLNILPCTNYNENINISGQADVWITLDHNQVKVNSQTVSNSTYVAINVTDYTMDYSGGRIMPLSTGGMGFGS